MRRLPLIALGLSLALPTAAGAQTFPTDAEWIALDCGGVPAFDPLDDEPSATNERDVVGDTAQPAVYTFADATHWFFRLRVDDDPSTGSSLRPFGWAVEIDSDADPSTYELLAIVDGITNPDAVSLQRNTVTRTFDDPADPAEEVITTYATGTHVRSGEATGPLASSFGGDADFFVDWAIAWADLAAEGVGLESEVVLFFGSSSNAQAINADLACHVGGTALTLSGIGTDVTRPDGVAPLDSDGDGLPDAVEVRIGTDPNVADTDGDGFTDAIEVRAGTDPTDASSFPAGVDGGTPTGIGVRGGPGGCAISSSAPRGGACLLLLFVVAMALRRRH